MHTLSIFTRFLKNQVWKIKFEKSSNLIFAGYTGSINPVPNRLKIQLVQLDLSNLIFQKSSSDQKDLVFQREYVFKQGNSKAAILE